MGAADSTTSPGRYGRLVWPAVVLCVAVHLLLASSDLTQVWLPDLEGWNGALFSLAGQNDLRHGLIATRLGSALDAGQQPGPPHDYYVNHPPLVGLIVGASFAVLGIHEWAARLPFLLLSAASVVLVFLLAARALGAGPGLVAAAVYAVLPMSAKFGDMPCHEPVVTAFLLLAVWQLLGFLANPCRPHAWGCLLALTVAQLTDWPGYYAAAGVALALVLTRPRSPANLRLALGVLVAAAVVLALVLAHAYLVAGSLEALTSRFRLWTGLKEQPAYTTLSYLRRTAWHARDWFTPTACVLAAVGLGLALARRRLTLSRAAALALTVPALTHLALFRLAAWAHEYWLFYFGPLAVLLVAVVAAELLDRVRGRRILQPAGAAVLVLAVLSCATWSVRYLQRADASPDLAAHSHLLQLRPQLAAAPPLVLMALYPQIPWYLDLPYDYTPALTLTDLLPLPRGTIVTMHRVQFANWQRELASAGYRRMLPDDIYNCAFLIRERGPADTPHRSACRRAGPLG